MLDDDDSTCSSVMSPSMDGTTTTANATAQISPDDPSCVKVPADNDVLCGRGGSINSHPGNERFRTLVEKRKRVYLTARFKREKRLIASSIVSEIRAINGRFLQRDPKSGLWKDIGDEKARDKTSQALRENAPSIRAEIEDEINELHHHSNSYTETDSPPTSASHHYPHAQPSSQQQQQYGWYHPSYYGYPQPPPHPVHSSNHPYPPPQHHTGYPPHPQPPSHHLHHHPSYSGPPAYHSSPYTAAIASSSSVSSRPKAKRTSSNSMIDLTADFVTSGAEAIKSWTTKATTSFGGDSSQAHHRGSHDGMTVATGTTSNPISYKHNNNDDVHHRRKIVKFRDDNHRHHDTTNDGTFGTSTNSIVQQHGSYDEDLEPQSVDVATNASLMSQVATHILGSFGSWQMDGTASICGGGSTSLFPMFYENDSKAPNMPQAPPSEYEQEEMNYEVEWEEGQEVQLVPDDRTNNDDKQRMPPPSPVSANRLRRGVGGSSNHSHGRDSHMMGASTAFSSLGSCHSWLPEQVAAASSYFSGRTDPDDDLLDDPMHMMHHGDYHSTGVANSSIAHSAAENYSMAGESIGGASLTKVFDNNSHHTDPRDFHNHHHHHHHHHHNHHSMMHPHQQVMSSPAFSHRDLHQIPSWERSLRSKSPSSFNDDESLISKTDSKGALSSVHSMTGSNADDMAWAHTTRIE